MHSFCGDDWQTCRDYVCSKLGMEPFKPNGGSKIRATYEFRDPTPARCDTGRNASSARTDPRNSTSSHLGEMAVSLCSMAASGSPILLRYNPSSSSKARKWLTGFAGFGAVAVSGDTGYSSKWLPAHADLLRGLPIILWPDSDAQGEDYAANAARCLKDSAASLKVVRPFGAPNGAKGRDVCDWHGNAEDLMELAAGAEPYEAHEQKRKEPLIDGQAKDEAAPRKPKMIIEWFGEAANSALSEPANQLIEGILDEGGLSVNYGDSGSGKTFVTLDLAFHVGAGMEWNGKKVRRGLVVYVAAEGGKRIKRRIAALQKRYRQDYGDVAPDPLFAIVRYQIDLRSNEADLNSLLALIRAAEKKTGEKCVWLIVDTLSRAMAAGDENSPVDMGRIVASADRFRAGTGAHFTYVHHTGKDAARGARGHSLLRAATDTETETTAGSLTLTEQRDGELGFKIGFRLVDLVIGEDPNGLCVKSAVVEWSSVQAPAVKAKRELAPSRRLLMSVVDEALAECGFDFTPWADGPAVRCVRDSVVRERYYTRIAEPMDGENEEKAYERKRKAWFRAVKAALDAKALMAAPYEEDRALWKP